jgi:hypothetical protein
MENKKPYSISSENPESLKEIRAHIAAVRMTQIQRYKAEGLELETDKSSDDMEASVADFQFLSYYFLDYFAHIINLNDHDYDLTARAILATDLKDFEKLQLPKRETFGLDFFGNEVRKSLKSLSQNPEKINNIVAMACICAGKLTYLISKGKNGAKKLFDLNQPLWRETISDTERLLQENSLDDELQKTLKKLLNFANKFIGQAVEVQSVAIHNHGGVTLQTRLHIHKMKWREFFYFIG